jgi:hypothetical protein
MNFGAPHMTLREPRESTSGSPRLRAHFARRGVHLRGTHGLVAYPGRWRLVLADGLTVRDTSSAKRLDMAVARLRGELLEAIAIDPRSGRSEFFFDLGARLTVRWPHGAPAAREEHGLWSLHDRSRVVAIFVGGKYDTCSLRTAAENPRPIGTSDWLIVARRASLERKVRGEVQQAAR